MKAPQRHDESLALSALALLPYFDYELGVDVTRLALVDDRRASDDRRARAAFDAVVSLGGVERVGDLLTMPATIKDGVIAALGSVSRSLTEATVTSFVSHLQGGMQSPARQLLGSRGFRLLELTFAAIRETLSDDRGDVNRSRLAHQVVASRDLGRLADLTTARTFLSQFLDPGDRLMLLIDAVEAWNADERSIAVSRLQRIAAAERADVIGALSDTLLGAELGARGDVPTAEATLRRGKETFLRLDDPRGASRVSMVHGRILVDVDRSGEGVELLEYAIESAEPLVPLYGAEARQTIGRSEIALSRGLRQLDRFVEAIERANLAVRRFEFNSDEWQDAGQNLVDLLIESGDFRSELRYAQLPADGVVPVGAAGAAVARSLLHILARTELKRSPASREMLFDRASALERVMQAETTRNDRESAQRALEEAVSAAETRVRLLAVQIDELRRSQETNDGDVADRLVDERRALMAGLYEHAPERHAAVLAAEPEA